MIPTELVHYTRKETALERILYEKKIKFSLLGKTNDPKETTAWHNSIITQNELSHDQTIDLMSKVNQIANEIMLEEWKVFCLTKHIPQNPKRKEPQEFSRAYCHPRLWADYGGNHSGVCLVFNGKKLNQNIHDTLSEVYRIFHGPVKYNDFDSILRCPIDVSRDLDINLEEIRKYFIKNYKDCFLRKTNDWRSEHEYRWLIHDKNKEPIYIPITGAIIGVIVGPDFPKVYETTLKLLCKELNIFAGKIEWFDGMPRVNFTEIYSP